MDGEKRKDAKAQREGESMANNVAKLLKSLAFSSFDSVFFASLRLSQHQNEIYFSTWTSFLKTHSMVLWSKCRVMGARSW